MRTSCAHNIAGARSTPYVQPYKPRSPDAIRECVIPGLHPGYGYRG